jgi:hypothetical protein
MNKFLLSSAFCLLLLSLTSCEDPKKAQILADSLTTRLAVLEDSIDANWKILSTTEKKVITDAAYLIEEVEKSPTFNKPLADSLKNLVHFIPTQYYTQSTLSDSTIDNYDKLVTKVIDNLPRLTASVPGADSSSQMFTQLTEIKNADLHTLSLRGSYEGFLHEYNTIIKEHTELLKRKKPDFKIPTPKPGFAVQ